MTATSSPLLHHYPGHAESIETGTLIRHRFARTRPLPTHLFAFNVGPFTTQEAVIAVTPQRAAPLSLRVIAAAPNADNLQYALAHSAPIVSIIESYLDLPFPFTKLDEVSSPAMPGGMENAGVILYGDPFFLIDQFASPMRQHLFDTVVGHEISHQWFGDLVTPSWWDDMWLSESFANWMGYTIANKLQPQSDAGSLSEEAFAAMDIDALSTSHPIHRAISRDDQIGESFDPITYGKGGQVVSMIAGYLGERQFARAVRMFLTEHAYGSANAEEFFEALARVANDPRVVEAMRSFVEQKGVSVIDIRCVRGSPMQLSVRSRPRRSGPFRSVSPSPVGGNVIFPTTRRSFCARRARHRSCQTRQAPGTIALR